MESENVRSTSLVNGTLTNTGRLLIWDWILGGSTARPPDYMWFGFSTSMPTEADTGWSVVELKPSYVVPPNNRQEQESPTFYDTGYERVKYPFGLIATENDRGWNSAGNGAYLNAQTIDFGAVPTGPDEHAWPVIRAWFMATKEIGGDIFAYGPTGAIEARPGDHVSIPSGSLMLQTVPMSI